MSNYPINTIEKLWQVIKNTVEPQEKSRKKNLLGRTMVCIAFNKSYLTDF